MIDRNFAGNAARRRFLKIGCLTLLGGVCGLDWLPGGQALAAVTAETHPAGILARTTRELTLRNTHTGEIGRLAYWADGRYLTEGLAAADRLLRDHRTDETHPIDPLLLDLLHDLAAELGVTPDYEVISGYRSPATNSALRSRSTGVAGKSYHMQGKAMDLRLAGMDLRRVHKAALALKRGGVGLYSGPGFIHVDTGPVRTW